jgi:hypothetical protein
MFRAAFPTASEADERCETIWVKETYDLGGNNDSTKEPGIVRLAGTWVGPDVALLPEFAQTYGLGGVIPHIAKAIPDPSAAYRRASTKTTPKAEPRSSPSANSNLPTPQDKSNVCDAFIYLHRVWTFVFQAGATETGAGILIQALPTTHIILTYVFKISSGFY